MAHKKQDSESGAVAGVQPTVARVPKKKLVKEQKTNSKKAAPIRKKKTTTATTLVHLNVGDSEPTEPQSVPIQSKPGGAATPYTERFQLALFKPPQKPSLRYDYILSQTARIAGLLFVVMGGLSTLFNMQYFGGATPSTPPNIAAQVSGTCTEEMLLTNPEYCTTQSGSTGTSGTGGSTDTQPDVNFALDVPSSGALSGTVPIYITVPNATGITLYAYEKSSGRTLSLGPASRANSTSSWILYWRTTEYNDGEYRLKALVTNNFGTYDEIDSVYRIIENHPLTTSENTGTSNTGSSTSTQTTTPTTSTTTATEAETSVTETPSIAIRPFSTATLQGSPRATIFALDADIVKLYLKNTTTGTSHFLGQAYEANEDTGEWRYTIQTTMFPNGAYTLRAVGSFDAMVIQSEPITISIQNTLTTTNTTATTTTTLTAPATTGTTTTTLAPKATLSVRQSGTLSGSVDVRVDVAQASFVELYAVPQYALTQIFLGLAQKIDTDRWSFKWNTTQIPNGTYRIFSKVKNSYGLYESDRVLVSVYNAPQTEINDSSEDSVTEEGESTPTPYEDLKTLRTTVDPIIAEQRESLYITTPAVIEEPREDTASGTDGDLEKDADDEDSSMISEVPDVEKPEDYLKDLLKDYQERIDEEIERLSSAIRSGDEVAIQRAKERLSALRDEIRASALTRTDEQSLISVLDDHIQKLFIRLQETTEKTEVIIKERVGEVITRDTDGDGITDYDEVNIYNTDPASADSDQDGFVDGVEILGGYDPKDSTPEVAVVYESPKDIGVIRDDILKIETVLSLKSAPDEQIDTPKPAVITGKALPNSFVTLYIFSTPIVVTVKTEADGTWSYVLDKELEDGEHEVYVGMTDNAGKIIAKSAPFAFVKTAEAYAPVASSATVATETSAEPSFLSQHLILVVLSIAVVALGLVLMMLGFHMDSRKKTIPETTTPQTDITPVAT